MSEILVFDSASIGYKESNELHVVLKDISFSMKRGEILGLAGESGSGKTTLARSILGMSYVIDGTITKNYDKIQMVFQDPFQSLNPSKTIKWILGEAFMLSYRKKYGRRPKTSETEKEVSKILEMVELPYELLNRKPFELSGGQRQRVCIAAALIQKPDFLIADEPVSALDVTIQAQIIELLKKIKNKTNLSILFISHDLRTMYNICDNIIVLHKGRIEEYGEPKIVYKKPCSEYTKLLLKSAGIISEEEEREEDV